MADRGGPPVSPNKRKHIVWNEQNLMYNEQNKSAKMTIDEPDTPWASPPRELFEDPVEDEPVRKTELDARADMDDVADRLREIDTSSIPGTASASRSDADKRGSDADAGVDGERANQKSEWDSSDDEADGAQGDDDASARLAFPDPGLSAGGDEHGEPEDFEAHTEADRELKARLFEAQRKSHQCTFRGVMARGRALLEEEEDDELV